MFQGARLIRGSHAVERGDLAAATQTLITLPEGSPESRELLVALYPRLLEARDYPRAGLVLCYIKEKALPPTSGFTVTTNGAAALSSGELGQHMGKNMQLREALALIASDPNLTTLRLRLLPQLFLGAVVEELPTLEKLTATLEGQERVIAIEAIILAYVQAENWESAWQWAAKLPPERQRLGYTCVLSERARVDPQGALSFLRTKSGTPEFRSLFAAALQGIATKPQELKQLLQLADSPRMRDTAIGIVLTQHHTRSLKDLLVLLDMQTDPAIRAWTLVRRNPTGDVITEETRQEFYLRTITPRLTALARQYPKLAPLHDEFLFYRMCFKPAEKFQERYLAKMLDPAKKKEWTPRLTPQEKGEKIRRINRLIITTFSLEDPVDADRLTGLRD